MAESGSNATDKIPVAGGSSPTVSFLETPEGRRLAYHRITGTSPGMVYIHGLNSIMDGLKAIALEEFCRKDVQLLSDLTCLVMINPQRALPTVM